MTNLIALLFPLIFPRWLTGEAYFINGVHFGKALLLSCDNRLVFFDNYPVFLPAGYTAARDGALVNMYSVNYWPINSVNSR